MQEPSRKTVATQEAGAWVIQFVDNDILDELSIARLGEELDGLIGRMQRPMLVLDFANVAHMSSSALGMLITLLKKVQEANGAMRLCNIRPVIRQVFEITKLADLFEIHESRSAALARLV
jgi:anti-anti-sigma factor